MFPISPRSANYERLEGGMGPSRLSSSKRPSSPHSSSSSHTLSAFVRRLTWKKWTALCFFGGVAFWWFWIAKGYKYDRSASLIDSEGDGYYGEFPGTDVATVPQPPEPAATPIHKPNNANFPGTSTDPISFSTDPNRTKTTHCTSPHTPSAPLVQYALMIDAGSTGSRIHIYKFHNCFSSPSFEWEVFHQTQPGLSSFALDPSGAAESLDVLMEKAVEVVPKALWSCTPVVAKATAGLRLLPGSQSEDILKAVEARLRKKWEFVVSGVSVMDGKDEGVYAWITANYLIGSLDSKKEKGKEGGSGTYGVLDLGGASTQIAFQAEKKGAVLESGDHRYELKFAQQSHILYQHSYLGFGLMKARQHIHNLVYFVASFLLEDGSDLKDSKVGNSCLARGSERTVKLERVGNVTFVGEDVGSFEACQRVVQLVVAKDAICKTKPCSFNGVYHPSILDAFPNGKILLLSYFYDRLAPLLPLPPKNHHNTDPDAPLRLPISTIASTARTVCSGRQAWLKTWGAHPDVMAELQGRPEWCLDLTYMYVLLTSGYGFREEREVEIAKKVGGTELGWCLGATLELVAGELKCLD